MTFLWLANAFGFVVANIRYFVIGFIIILLLVAIGLTHRACNKPPKLDEKAIQTAQTAIATQDRKVMVDILAESDAKEKVIDQNVANAKVDTINAKTESKAKWEQATNQELADELEKRSHE